MSLRIAIAGKGGTGKTTISALLCRALMQKSLKPLLAVDADPNSCLPEKLGVRGGATIGDLRERLRADPESVPAGISKQEWIESLINSEVTESIGFDMIVMGRQEGPSCYCYINNLLRECLFKIAEHYRAVVIDNEAGLEHLSRRTNGRVDAMLVVCQPTIIGARTAVRVTDIIKGLELEVGASYLVLNACAAPLDAGLKEEFAVTGLDILGTVPSDPDVLEFEKNAQSLLAMPADAAAVMAVEELLDNLLKRRQK